MRVVLAGATGAVGRPLTRQLVEAGHQVTGLTRTEQGVADLQAAGADAVRVDIMDREELLKALAGRRADAVVHELTALRKTPVRYQDMAATNALRITGTAHLLAAADLLGAHRFVTQSIVLGYGYGDHGNRPVTEEDPFAVPVRSRLTEVFAALASTERQVFHTPGMEGVALRYGMFYGDPAMRNMAGLLRRRRLPAPAAQGNRLPWIHVEDAARATVLALEKGRPGQAYNVADDEPAPLGALITELAAVSGAPRPWTIPVWLARPVPYFYALLTTNLRVSTAKAKDELGWVPTYPSYREGLRALAR